MLFHFSGTGEALAARVDAELVFAPTGKNWSPNNVPAVSEMKAHLLNVSLWSGSVSTARGVLASVDGILSPHRLLTGNPDHDQQLARMPLPRGVEDPFAFRFNYLLFVQLGLT